MSQSNANFNDFLDNFESQGATLTRRSLIEGNYKANISGIRANARINVAKTGKNVGQEFLSTSWSVSLALDSESAQEQMKQDNDVIVYADSDTIVLGRGAYLNVGEFGVSIDNNIAFWSFIGSIFAQVGLATKQQDDSGAATYKLDRNIINSIYQGTQEELEKLQADSEVNPLIIPGKLAEIQLKNLSELITSETDTRKVYVDISRRKDYRDKSQTVHYVRNIMLPEAFEEREENVASLIL